MTMGPTREFVEECVKLSRDCLDDSVALFKQERARSSIDRAYYAMHWGAVALPSDRGIEPPKSHSGLVSVFGLEMVTRGTVPKEFGRMLSTANKQRNDQHV